MKNIDLNAGGLIGALACGGIAAAVLFSSVDTPDTGRGPYKMIIFALVAGAFAGNFFWGLVFKKLELEPKSSVPERHVTDENDGIHSNSGHR